MLPTLFVVIWEAPLSLQALTAGLTITLPPSPHRGKHVTPTAYSDPAHSQSLPWHCRMNRDRALLPPGVRGRGSPWPTCPLLTQNGARQSGGGLHLNPRTSVPELDSAALGASGSYFLLLVNERGPNKQDAVRLDLHASAGTAALTHLSPPRSSCGPAASAST